MATENPRIPLPKSWSKQVRSALLHVISLAQFATAYTRGWAADGVNTRIRLKAECDRLIQELTLLCEEIRIKDARMGRIIPFRRPHYPPTERMAILELRAARGWSLEQAARVFQVTAATIASWTRRIDEAGSDALVQMRTPVNRFPDFVRYAVQRLKVLCPSMGKVKIAQTLARAGLHISATTIGRILKEDHRPTSQPATRVGSSDRVVTAKYRDHVWHIDLTVVPIGRGFWCSFHPNSLKIALTRVHANVAGPAHGISVGNLRAHLIDVFFCHAP